MRASAPQWSRWRSRGAVAACGSDQDPGITPQDTSGGPATTSHLLSSCPTDGTAPTAGCLDEDGKVVHP